MGQTGWALHLASSYHGSDWLALHLAPSYHGSDCLALQLSAVDMDSERTKVKPVDCIRSAELQLACCIMRGSDSCIVASMPVSI
ncbi:hypothetical protein DPMN_150176 [Dreissena polymorpha]|uniref:Uncharacterized protein n=1 Tax=Dreissena polymorpha TaxID=45954 RepID=A0A9D4FIU0_DREPO|nr:hypothetical protein DPMN_150176 [Dreissena polymorpha]